MDKRRILVVDDEVAFTRLLKLALEHRGCYTVEVENSACRAVQAAIQFQPDLVLMDVMMPKLDGGSLALERKEAMRSLTVFLGVWMLTVGVSEASAKVTRGPSAGE